ncbi:hypothetical protein JL107_17160 [Nakamurella flavida]|uniref:DUF4913 domain-containing protein n=1 Tax=Nakamurella flavida TaxID=363630 RepID=A0A938YSQ4_9ACTN|nr:hypothetical protein [Nakamurella flavida]MBM9478180.1 hypothetical protein [Nakamurella flavida]MDP9778598.1 hypothetical protein [Nakamurella flavida]
MDTGLADDERLRRTLHDWFAWMTAAYAQHPDDPGDVPAGLAVPHWSWAGPVD